jgi:hypothetical protein
MRGLRIDQDIRPLALHQIENGQGVAHDDAKEKALNGVKK